MTLTETLKKMSPKSALSYFDQKLKYEIGPVELKQKIDRNHSDFLLVDVRSQEAYQHGHIVGAKSIPFEDFDHRFPEFSEHSDNIVYCYSMTCQLSYKAARWLSEKGFPAKVLIGGFDEWEKGQFPVEK